MDTFITWLQLNEQKRTYYSEWGWVVPDVEKKYMYINGEEDKDATIHAHLVPVISSDIYNKGKWKRAAFKMRWVRFSKERDNSMINFEFQENKIDSSSLISFIKNEPFVFADSFDVDVVTKDWTHTLNFTFKTIDQLISWLRAGDYVTNGRSYGFDG